MHHRALLAPSHYMPQLPESFKKFLSSISDKKDNCCKVNKMPEGDWKENFTSPRLKGVMGERVCLPQKGLCGRISFRKKSEGLSCLVQH